MRCNLESQISGGFWGCCIRHRYREACHTHAHARTHPRGHTHTVNLYLCTVLGLGHSYQELEYGLGLGHQRGDSMDDRCELGVWFNSWNTTETRSLINAVLKNPQNNTGWNTASRLSVINAISSSLKRISRKRTEGSHSQTLYNYFQWKILFETSLSAVQKYRWFNCQGCTFSRQS